MNVDCMHAEIFESNWHEEHERKWKRSFYMLTRFQLRISLEISSFFMKRISHFALINCFECLITSREEITHSKLCVSFECEASKRRRAKYDYCFDLSLSEPKFIELRKRNRSALCCLKTVHIFYLVIVKTTDSLSYNFIYELPTFFEQSKDHIFFSLFHFMFFTLFDLAHKWMRNHFI